MPIGRRAFLKTVGLATIAPPFLGQAFAESTPFAPKPGAPRTFEIVTHVEVQNAKGVTRVWVPAPSNVFQDWFVAFGTSFTGNAKDAGLKKDPVSGAAYVEASWDGEAMPVLEVTSRFSTRDRSVDPSNPGKVSPLSASDRALYLKPTRYIPTDGIVKATSDRITAGSQTDLAKVQAIYDWVVDNTYRDPATRGCGSGDIAAMLRTGAMGGKCADINGLFVGLVRAAGVPARDIYGIRVAPSQFGYKSLGANSQTITKSQHCRAEVYLSGVGWFPVDPADVRKVALEEPPGHLDMSSEKVAAARKTLFGAWETNWLAYNHGQDVRLTQAKAGSVPFLMYPQGEIDGATCDCLEPDKFRYSITAREIV
jgi:transglutaminase-like putative cysteine protease